MGSDETRTAAGPGRGRLEAYRKGEATAILLADHDWLRAALAELRPRALAAGERADLEALAESIWQGIQEHSQVEEQIYFPGVERLLAEAGRHNPMVQAMAAERDALPERYRQLQQSLALSTELLPAIDAFARALLVHFDNEEDLVFEEAMELERASGDSSLARAVGAFLDITGEEG
jgi:iron-sulfur cluster repair protein YtfE (RIC family)